MIRNNSLLEDRLQIINLPSKATERNGLHIKLNRNQQITNHAEQHEQRLVNSKHTSSCTTLTPLNTETLATMIRNTAWKELQKTIRNTKQSVRRIWGPVSDQLKTSLTNLVRLGWFC